MSGPGGGEVPRPGRLLRPVGVLLAAGTCVVLFALLSGVAAATHRADAPPPRPRVPVVTATPATATPSFCGHAGTVSHLRVPDPAARGGFRAAWVYRPPGPPSPLVPVVYLLHGLPGDPSDFAGAGLTGDLDRSLCTTYRGFVVVAPDGTVPDGRDTEWADAPDGSFALESFVTGPLIAAVEGAQRRPASLRAIGGFSMGGFAAASLGLRHRDLYGTMLAVAGYFHLDDPDASLGQDRGLAEQHDPDRLLAAAPGLHVFLADGAADTLAVVAGESQRFAAELTARQVDTVLDIVPGGHDGSTLAAALPAAFAYAASRMPGVATHGP